VKLRNRLTLAFIASLRLAITAHGRPFGFQDTSHTSHHTTSRASHHEPLVPCGPNTYNLSPTT